MTNQQWQDLCQSKYQELALALLEQHYEQVKRQDIYKYHFVKGDEKLVIVRKPGSANWYTREL